MNQSVFEYVYKGFKVSYNIELDKTSGHLFKANGYAECLVGKEQSTQPPRKFHTEYSTLVGVQTQIKKLVEDYIDFEWEEFKKMHD